MMNQHLVSLIATTTVLLLSSIAQAQVYQPSNRNPIADNTLRTQVSSTGNNQFRIDGGLITNNILFHSFQDFSIPTGGSANFTKIDNRDIITRVTGNLFSDINGTLNTNGANFLLINPNGIVFGANAQLNVGKAFVTSTANGINLVDGAGRAIVFGTNPSNDTPLLTINPNVAFNISNLTMGTSRGNISNFGTLQTNNDSQYIGLIGGNVNLTGGKIIAPGGRVDIGGLNTPGTVSINSDGLGFNGTNLVRGDVSIVNGSSISVRANQSLNPVNPIFFPAAISPGSSINISANRIDLIDSGSRFLGGTDNPINQALGGLDAGLDVNSGIKTGTIGNISLDATGDIKIQKSAILNLVRTGSQGNGGGIKISGNNITVTNKSEVSTNLSENAIGRGGDINITAAGNFDFSQPNYPDVVTPLRDLGTEFTADSLIAASTHGSGDSGKVKIAAGGSVLVSDNSAISSTVGATGIGNSAGIKIDANSLIVRNGGQILTAAESTTNQPPNTKNSSGNIDVTTKEDIKIFGSNNIVTTNANNNDRFARIESNSFRTGDAGKVTLNAGGKLSIVNRAEISSSIRKGGNGTGGGINLNVRELLLSNLSYISSYLGGRSLGKREPNAQGKSGDININAIGDITIDESLESLLVKEFEGSKTTPSLITNSIHGTGKGGKIIINTRGKVTVGNHDGIVSTVEPGGGGDPGGITINAGELEVYNEGQILTVASRVNNGKPGNSGNIDIKTTGDITIAGNRNLAVGRDDAEQNLSKIASSSFRQGNAGKITIDAGGTISLFNKGGIVTQRIADTSGYSAGDITINSKKLILDRGNISLNATYNGGNIIINTQDLVLMRRNSGISTDSKQGGNGGNINIDSKFILASKENNDITANAVSGQGGNVNINSQGVFGIQFRAQRIANSSDITASSELGQSGNVKINTPGVDPCENNGELTTVTNDASNQISQACGAEQRDSKFYITGRGGLPPTAAEPLESPALWEDARGVKTKSIPTANSSPQLAPPAVAWVFEPNGKVRLVAAQSAEGAARMRGMCSEK